MQYHETPEIAAAINRLVLEYGREAWFYQATQTSDGAGTRVLVQVLDAYYSEDVLPRRVDNVYLVVQRWRPAAKEKLVA